jgi:hypothetical protein
MLENPTLRAVLNFAPRRKILICLWRGQDY